MTPRITLTEVSHSFGPRTILDSVGLELAAGDRTALTGANGAGKTTLMRIMAGEIRPGAGRVSRAGGTTAAYLPQILPRDLGDGRSASLYRFVEGAFDPLFDVQEELRGLEHRMAELEVETPETGRLLARYSELQGRLTDSRFYSREQSIGRVLTGLGFSEEDQARPLSSFSSGWKMRALLAKTLLSGGDILLMDEPTNYLDLEAREWLEGYLRSFSGAFLIVSHDRYFLDITVSEVVELYRGRLTRYRGTYSRYEARREKELEEVQSRYESQREEIEKLEAFIRRFQSNASKARLVQSRIKALEKMERIEPPPVARKVHFRFPPSPRSGRVAVRLESVSHSFGSVQALCGLDLELLRGDKLVIVGPNGAGKSTAMKLMGGTLTPASGSVSFGKDVSTGYFSPEASDSLSGTQSILELLEDSAPTFLVPQLRTLLGAFLFQGEDVYKPVSVLSGGEKSRLHLLRLLLHPTNLLLLDEPTNHLDMASKDVLLDALTAYDGTLVFVSHDRYFIEGLANRVLELRGGHGRLYYGDYRYYLWKKEQELGTTGPAPERSAADPGGRNGRAGRTGATGSALERSDGGEPEAKVEWEREKRMKSRVRKLEKEESRIVERLDALDADCRRIEREMAEEESYLDAHRIKELKESLERNRWEHEALARKWEEVAEELRGLAG